MIKQERGSERKVNEYCNLLGARVKALEVAVQRLKREITLINILLLLISLDLLLR